MHVMICILSAFVGWCIDCKNMYVMNNIKLCLNKINVSYSFNCLLVKRINVKHLNSCVKIVMTKWKVEVYLHSFMTSTLSKSDWSAPQPRPFYGLERNLNYRISGYPEPAWSFRSGKKIPRRKRNHDLCVFHPVTEELYLLRYRTVLFHALGVCIR